MRHVPHSSAQADTQHGTSPRPTMARSSPAPKSAGRSIPPSAISTLVRRPPFVDSSPLFPLLSYLYHFAWPSFRPLLPPSLTLPSPPLSLPTPASSAAVAICPSSPPVYPFPARPLTELTAAWQNETFIEHVFGGLTWALDGATTRAYGQGLVGNNATAPASSASGSGDAASTGTSAGGASASGSGSGAGGAVATGGSGSASQSAPAPSASAQSGASGAGPRVAGAGAARAAGAAGVAAGLLLIM